MKHGTPTEVVRAIQKKVAEIERVQRTLPQLEQQRSFNDYNKSQFDNYRSQEGNYRGGKLEIEIAMRILPHVTSFNKDVLKPDGSGKLTEIDIGTTNFIVEVTAKKDDFKKVQQISTHLTYDKARRDVILVAPNATPDIINAVKARGGYYAKDGDELAALISKLTPG